MSNPMKKFVKLLGKSERVYCQCVGESVYITDGYIAIKVPKFWYDDLILTESPIFQPLNNGEIATKDCNAKICKTVPNGIDIAAVISGYVKKEILWKSPFLMEVPLDKKTAQLCLFVSENEIIPVRSAFVEACEDFVTGDYYGLLIYIIQVKQREDDIVADLYYMTLDEAECTLDYYKVACYPLYHYEDGTVLNEEEKRNLTIFDQSELGHLTSITYHPYDEGTFKHNIKRLREDMDESTAGDFDAHLASLK